MNNLVIVESPTKARTLSAFLGKDYEIIASMGHVRDLPRGEFGVDVEHDFEPKYVIPKEKIKAVNKLVKQAVASKKLWLATDPDREGEAIGWNLLEVIKQKGGVEFDSKNYNRVVFHEITKEAVFESFNHPRKLDENLVEAQQARRILDRVVGYKLSPLLWKKVKSGLSAGRVQSVALRLIVDREREILAFKSDEYWIIEALLQPKTNKQEFIATLSKIENAKAEVKNQKESDAIVADLKKSEYEIVDLAEKEVKKYPNPPFTTSTLQQSAANKLGFNPGRTMRIAQDLYEHGFITYMRTDSVNLSENALSSIRQFIEKQYGKEYLPPVGRKYKAKSRLAQEAHEAIRPTKIDLRSDELKVTSADHQKLYDLIWKRAVVCQMAEAIVMEATLKIKAGKYELRSNGQKVKFLGWYKVYEKLPIKEQALPDVKLGDKLDLLNLNPMQKFTEPPARFSEATLIKELEKNDIGRPSTYAPTISTLYERAYIERGEGKQILPTPIGTTTVDFLVKYFDQIMDLSFTAEMEDDLDEIAKGNKHLDSTMAKFWKPFEAQVEKVLESADKMKVEAEVTEEVCEKCGKPIVIRYGRFGKFMACSGFPDCKNTKALVEDSGLTCPDCGGNIVMKKTKRGKTFWGCSNYPKCKYASWQKPNLEKNTEEKSEAVETSE